MKRLKIILQSNIFLILLISITIIYVLFNLNKEDMVIKNNNFEGIIESYKIDGDKLTLQLKNKKRIIANYYIKSENEKKYLENNIKLGYKVKLKGTFTKPNNNTIPYNFNYKKYLKTKKIDLIMNTKKYYLMKNSNILYKLKNFIIKIIDKRKNSDYYYTFILGNKDNLDEKVYDSYKINGVTHLFAISGMHISMLILIFDKLKFKKIFIIILLYIYCFLVMFTPSVLRVTIFYTLRNINLFGNISNSKLLMYVAIILIFSNPCIVMDVGFQYSFIITLGLFLLKPKNLVSLSFYAFILSLPITLYNNYEFNLFSILINIIVVPYVSFLLYPFLLLTLLLPFLEPFLSILIYLLEFINLFANKASFMIVTGQLNLMLLLLYYLILILFIKFKNKKILLILILIIMINKYKYIFDNNYYVYYLDVGQGDSSVIVYPKHKDVIMIDTGGTISYSKEKWQQKNKKYNKSNNLISFLKGLGITKINYLILTHGDYDHMGEAINLVNNFKVENVIFNSDEFNDLEQELIKILESKKIKYYKGLKELDISNDKLIFLNIKEYNNENDNSNVLYFKINKYQFLFMGDAGIQREKDILDKYNLINIDFIKIGHHGSDTSSNKYFINSIKPKNCLISVGKNNRYGHPKESVVNTLDDYCDIYRTDLNGSVEIKINRNNYKIKTYSL